MILKAFRCTAGHLTTVKLEDPDPVACTAPVQGRPICGRAIEPYTLRPQPPRRRTP